MNLLLITGFLGAGKTTFLKGLLAEKKGLRLSLIVNEFGKVGVDGALLDGLSTALHEVVGGSIFCTCRLDQFEATLCKVVLEQPDEIWVEASGLSDPTAIRAVLKQYPQITYKGCIALCDAKNVEKLLSTARVCQKQFSVSDLILLNKIDLVGKDEALRLQALLSNRFPLAQVFPTTQGRFEPSWISKLDHHAVVAANVPFEESRDITLQKASVHISPCMTHAQCMHFIQLFVEETYRVKGFLLLAEGWFLADCVGAHIELTSCEAPRAQEMQAAASTVLVALAGQGMSLRKALREAVTWYPEQITAFTFD
ncbi:MAG: GTP-binding protein [Clostridia bacterium]